MQTKDKIIALFSIAVLVLLAYLWFGPSGVQPAPDIDLKVIDGRTLDLKQMRGQPVLVTFWATSCPGCIKEMPHLIELYHQLHDKGLEIIAVAMPYDRPDHVMEMAKRKQIPYPIAIDIKGEAVAAFGNVKLTPTSFLIDPDGKIVKQKIGEMDMTQLRQQITAMLNNSKQAS
jgi:peroxiredoxin